MVVFVVNEIVFVKTTGSEKSPDEILAPSPDTVQIISTKILSTLSSVPHMLKNFAKIVTGRCSESELFKKFYQYQQSQQQPKALSQSSNLLKDDAIEEHGSTTSTSTTDESSSLLQPQIVFHVNQDQSTPSSQDSTQSPPIPHSAIYSFNYDLSNLEPGFILRYASESKKKIDLILIRSIYKHNFSFSKKNVPTVIQTYELFEINEEHDTPYLLTTGSIPPAILSKLIKHQPLPDQAPPLSLSSSTSTSSSSSTSTSSSSTTSTSPQKVTTINIDQMTYKQIVQHASSNKKKEANIAAINNLIKQNATSYSASKKNANSNNNTFSNLNNTD